LFARGFGLDDEGDELEEGSKDGLKPGQKKRESGPFGALPFHCLLTFPEYQAEAN
jgi:hypothetical protein